VTELSKVRKGLLYRAWTDRQTHRHTVYTVFILRIVKGVYTVKTHRGNTTMNM